MISSSLTISPIKNVLFYKDCFIQALLSLPFYFVYWMNRWVLVWIHFNVFKGDPQTKTLKRVFTDHIQSAFSSIHVFFKKKQKAISHVFLPAFSGLFSMYWHHSWHNNRLRRLTGLWGKKNQCDLGEGILGMLVQCTKDSHAVLTVEALCVLSCNISLL